MPTEPPWTMFSVAPSFYFLVCRTRGRAETARSQKIKSDKIPGVSVRGRHYYKTHDVVFSSRDRIAMWRTTVSGFIFVALDFHYIVSRRGGPEERTRLASQTQWGRFFLDWMVFPCQRIPKDSENGHTSSLLRPPAFLSSLDNSTP